MRHVNEFDFATLSCCIGLLPLGYRTLFIALGKGWRILGESMVKREGGGRRAEGGGRRAEGGGKNQLSPIRGRGD